MKIRKNETYQLKDGGTATVLMNYIRKQEVLAQIDNGKDTPEEKRMSYDDFEAIAIEAEGQKTPMLAGSKAAGRQSASKGTPKSNGQAHGKQLRMRNGTVATYEKKGKEITYRYQGNERTVSQAEFDELVENKHFVLL